MKYRLLGNSGLRVSEASLGTMTFGDEWGWGSPKTEAQKVYETYREAGGNFIDTANFYTGGTSEKFLGEFMEGHRDSVVLATKYSNAAPGNDPNAAGNHRKSMMQAVEASLKRLQTIRVDAVAARIKELTDTHLRTIAVTENGWETLYRDPTDLRFWELTYPHSEMHGGGPPMLRCITAEEAHAKYTF